MFSKPLPQLIIAVLALVGFWAQPACAHDKAEGTFVSAKDGKLTLTTKKSDKKNTFDLGKDAKVSLDGKPAKIQDLKAGFAVTVELGEEHVVLKIIAKSKSK